MTKLPLNPTPTPPKALDILVLGAGWTSTFLLPLLKTHHLTHATTTRSGRGASIPFTFAPDSTALGPYTHLPLAKTVLITFPLQGTGQSRLLTELYARTHAHAEVPTRWVQPRTPPTRWPLPGAC